MLYSDGTSASLLKSAALDAHNSIAPNVHGRVREKHLVVFPDPGRAPLRLGLRTNETGL